MIGKIYHFFTGISTGRFRAKSSVRWSFDVYLIDFLTEMTFSECLAKLRYLRWDITLPRDIYRKIQSQIVCQIVVFWYLIAFFYLKPLFLNTLVESDTWGKKYFSQRYLLEYSVRWSFYVYPIVFLKWKSLFLNKMAKYSFFLNS